MWVSAALSSAQAVSGSWVFSDGTAAGAAAATYRQNPTFLVTCDVASRLVLRLVMAAETGETGGDAIFSQTFVAVARK